MVSISYENLRLVLKECQRSAWHTWVLTDKEGSRISYFNGQRYPRLSELKGLTPAEREAISNSLVLAWRKVGEHLVGVSRFAFTYGLIFKIDPWGQERSYCYEHFLDALADLEADEDIDAHPKGPWIKCKGTYLGQFADILNPNIKEIHS